MTITIMCILSILIFRAVSSVTSVLFFPIIPWLMQIGTVAYAISVGVFLATTGESQYHYSNIADNCNNASGWMVRPSLPLTMLINLF